MTFILCPLIDFLFFCCFFGLLPLAVATADLLPSSHLPLSHQPSASSLTTSLYLLCDRLRLCFLPGSSVFTILCPIFPLSLPLHMCLQGIKNKSPLLCFSLSKYNPFVCVCVWKLVCVSECQEGDAYGLTNKSNPVISQKSDAYPSAFDQPRSLLLVWLQYLAPRGDTCR